MENGELTREQLEEIKAGIPIMTKEELEAEKAKLEAFSESKEDELGYDTLSHIIGGSNLSYDDAEEYFDEHVSHQSGK